MVGSVSSRFHAPFRFMDCLYTHVIIFMLRHCSMSFSRNCANRSPAHKMVCSGWFFSDFFHRSFLKPEFCFPVRSSFHFHPQFPVRLFLRQFIYCMICFISGFFCFLHSFFTLESARSSSVKRRRVGRFAIRYASFSFATSFNFVVMIRYSSRSFGKRSTNGRITLP